MAVWIVQTYFAVFKGLRLGDRWRLRLRASNSCLLSCPLFININYHFLLRLQLSSCRATLGLRSRVGPRLGLWPSLRLRVRLGVRLGV